MSGHLRLLWPHEAIRARPGLYLEAPADRSAQARALVRGAVRRFADVAAQSGSEPVRLRIWRGLSFELGFQRDEPIADPQRELAVAVRTLTDHALDPAELPQAFVPLVGFGPVLSALCERLLLVGERRGARWRCRLSRGGLLDQSCEPATPAPASLRLVFELDRLVFDDSARASAAADEALGGLAPGGPAHHPIGPEELVWDPW